MENLNEESGMDKLITIQPLSSENSLVAMKSRRTKVFWRVSWARRSSFNCKFCDFRIWKWRGKFLLQRKRFLWRKKGLTLHPTDKVVEKEHKSIFEGCKTVLVKLFLKDFFYVLLGLFHFS